VNLYPDSRTLLGEQHTGKQAACHLLCL